MSESGRVQRIVTSEDVNVDWEYENDRPIAYVYVFSDLYGVVGVGESPGYSRFAMRDCPLGRVMEIEE
jgi:hypothetical protein